MEKSSRIYSLDGIRAISIGLVLVGHIHESGRLVHALEPSSLGVQIFFVVSGLLITTLLLREHTSAGRISISRFYFRRTLRIFPPFYVFLAVMLVLRSLGWIELPWADVVHAFTYTMNYATEQRAWFLGHIWSLSVEEQFYLLWPAVLVLCGLRRGFKVAVAFLFAAPFIRVLSWQFLPASRAGIGETFPTAADAIVTGCVLAFARDWLWEQAWYRRFFSSPLFLAVPILAFAIHAQGHHALFTFLFGITAVNVLIALCIEYAIRFPEGAVGRVLNCRPVAFVGVTSYSIYLWQQIFLHRGSTAWINQFPQNLLLLFVPALLSYFVVEKQALRLREVIELWVSRLPPRLSFSGSAKPAAKAV